MLFLWMRLRERREELPRSTLQNKNKEISVQEVKIRAMNASRETEEDTCNIWPQITYRKRTKKLMLAISIDWITCVFLLVNGDVSFPVLSQRWLSKSSAMNRNKKHAIIKAEFALPTILQ